MRRIQRLKLLILVLGIALLAFEPAVHHHAFAVPGGDSSTSQATCGVCAASTHQIVPPVPVIAHPDAQLCEQATPVVHAASWNVPLLRLSRPPPAA